MKQDAFTFQGRIGNYEEVAVTLRYYKESGGIHRRRPRGVTKAKSLSAGEKRTGSSASDR